MSFLYKLQTTANCVQVVLRLGAGEIFGEISFLDAGDTGASTSVHAESEVCIGRHKGHRLRPGADFRSNFFVCTARCANSDLAAHKFPQNSFVGLDFFPI